VYSSGQVELLFNYYLTKPPFDDESLKQQFISRLNAIPGVSIPADGTRPRPNFPLLRLVESGALQAFLSTFDWFIARVREQPA
jgi:hypothetical protein